MTALAVGLAFVAAIGLAFTYFLIRALMGVMQDVQREHTLGRETHGEQIFRLIRDLRAGSTSAEGERDRLSAEFIAERLRWETERAILISRIQDPPAGVAMAMAVLEPREPGDLDVDFS